MFEVIYTSPESSVVEQTYFESAEDYYEWRESHPEYEILEILEELLS